MKSLLLASAAVLTLGFAAPASADCAADIAALKSQIFTGSVTSADQAGHPAPAADARAATAPAAGGARAAGETVAATGTASAQKPAADLGGAQPAETPATAAMNAATQGVATSAEEVAAQPTAQPAETAPTAEQLASAGQPPAPSASPTSNGEPVDMQATILARAEAYQKLGNEGACENALDQAKALQ